MLLLWQGAPNKFKGGINVKKKVLICSLIAALLIPISVKAASSTANITWNQTGIDGPEIYINRYMYLSGYNNPNSSRNLFVEAYYSQFGPDMLALSKKCAPGSNVFVTGVTEGGNYYVHLDPEGPYTSGCYGNGTLSD